MKILRKIKWPLLIALFLFASVYYWDVLENILDEIKKLPFSVLLISLALGTGFFVFEGKIIQSLANKYVSSFSYRQGLECAYYCAFYRFTTLGTGTGISEVYYLSKSGVPASKATGVGLVQYAFQKITIAVYGAVSFIAFSESLSSAIRPYAKFIAIGTIITASVATFLISASTSKKLASFLILILDRIAARFVKYRTRIDEAKKSITTLHGAGSLLLKDRKRLAILLTSNVFKLTCWYLIPATVLYKQSSLSIGSLLALMAICNMLAGVIPAPSGVGPLEFTFFLLFGKVADIGLVGSSFITYRFSSWIFPFLVGFVFIGLRKIGVRPGSSSE